MNHSELETTKVNNLQMIVFKSELQGLFPEKYILVLNSQTRILSLLGSNPTLIIAQQQFTKNEWSILTTLLASYPHYAPHEILLASLTSLSVTDCRKRLHEAEQMGSIALKRELKPVHRALNGIRAKLRLISPHLKVSLIRDGGYALTSSSDLDFDSQD